MTKREIRTLAGFMDPGNTGQKRLARYVEGALREVASLELAHQILTSALAADNLTEVPGQLMRFSVFVAGSLHEHTKRALGPEAAEEVLDNLQTLLDATTAAEEPPTSEGSHAEATKAGDDAIALVVDEDIAVRSQVQRMLKAAGYVAVAAPDSNVALAMCVRYRPRLVISGVTSDESRGRQLLALLRVAFGEEAPPLVLLGDDGGALGDAVAIVPKPVDEGRLLEAVEPLLT